MTRRKLAEVRGAVGSGPERCRVVSDSGRAWFGVKGFEKWRKRSSQVSSGVVTGARFRAIATGVAVRSSDDGRLGSDKRRHESQFLVVGVGVATVQNEQRQWYRDERYF